ncbi:MAG: Arm DNA-binding domain-containing protein, partial [Pseudomonadota bacterium]
MRAVNQLTISRVKSLSATGRYADGAGLYLYIAKGGSKSWVYRWKTDGRRRELGLGGFPTVTLARARERAAKAREQVLDGVDPIADKKKQKEPIFSECVEQFLSSMETQWGNEKHRQQWRMTLTKYCSPISDMRVSKIDTQDVLSVLQPIWQSKNETASRLRGRIERVLDFATIHGWRDGNNPALWRGHLKSVLPARQKLTRGHHAAISYKDLPKLVEKLMSSEATSA